MYRQGRGLSGLVCFEDVDCWYIYAYPFTGGLPNILTILVWLIAMATCPPSPHLSPKICGVSCVCAGADPSEPEA